MYVWEDFIHKNFRFSFMLDLSHNGRIPRKFLFDLQITQCFHVFIWNHEIQINIFLDVCTTRCFWQNANILLKRPPQQHLSCWFTQFFSYLTYSRILTEWWWAWSSKRAVCLKKNTFFTAVIEKGWIVIAWVPLDLNFVIFVCIKNVVLEIL